MPSPNKLFVSCHYHILFVCPAPMVFKVNTANIQYFWIFSDIQITQDPLCTAVLSAIFFFMTTPTRNSCHFSVLLAVKHVYLILWHKKYVAFNDLYHLKTLLCECKMSFKIGSLRCVKYIEKTQYQHSIRPSPPTGETVFSPKFWKRIRKK